VVALSSPPTASYDAYSPLTGHPAPGFHGTSLSGSPFNLSAQRGHYVIIDFFASWCVPCRQEEPQLVSFAKHHLGGPVLVGVIFHDSVASVRSLLGPWIGLYPVLDDPGGLIANSYGVGLPPMKFLINPRGKVVAKILGPVTEAGLDSLIATARKSGR
jgi:cytochrome c biogenesis protein CcmG/thiol:disulfide interchange protein DsbE